MTAHSQFWQLLATWHNTWLVLVMDTSADTTQVEDSEELSSTDRITTDLTNKFQQDIHFSLAVIWVSSKISGWEGRCKNRELIL